MTTTLGLDVYAGNGAVDFAKAKTEDNVAFVLAKATEGVTFNDARFADNWTATCNAGLQPGAYHFARPDNNAATTEAEHFLRILGDRRGIIALDLERIPLHWPLFQLAQWASTWLDIVASRTGLTPFLYTYHRWAFTTDFNALRSRWPLWVPLDPTTAKEITQTAKVIGTLGTLDVDTYGGTLAELQAACGLITAPAPTPVPIPAQPVPLPSLIPGGTGMYIFQVTDGPAINTEIYDYGFGPVHINGAESAELTAAGVKVVPISGATFAARFPGVA